MPEKPILLIVGQTASGTSTFAINLARALNAEIVSRIRAIIIANGDWRGQPMHRN